MFTGLVEEVGEIVETKPMGGGVRLRITTPLAADLSAGDSLAVNGVCLTVILADGSDVHADVGPETLRVTTLGSLARESIVNLERPLRADSRFGGHFVQGHVDGVGTVERVAERQDARLLDLRVPPEVARVSVPLGSITVDGVSLTVNAIPSPGVIQISLIPFTLQHTTLAERRPGDRVHLEADTIGKYVAELLRARGDLGAS